MMKPATPRFISLAMSLLLLLGMLALSSCNSAPDEIDPTGRTEPWLGRASSTKAPSSPEIPTSDFENVFEPDKQPSSQQPSNGQPEELSAQIVKLPPQYSLVVGDTFELFYKGILNYSVSEYLDVEVICAKGSPYTNRFVYTPTAGEIGTVPLTVHVYDVYGRLIDTGSTNLVVNAKPASPTQTVNVLCVGDSLTKDGHWVAEMNRRLTGAGGTPAGDGLTNIRFLGTRINGSTRYEGYGGWRFDYYNAEGYDPDIRNITCASHDKIEIQDQCSIYRDEAGNQWRLESVMDENTLRLIAYIGSGTTFPPSGRLTHVSGGVHTADIIYTATEVPPGNPFWNPAEERVDFASYAARQGASSLDYVYVFLGWNNVSTPLSMFKEQAQAFINHVHASFPHCQIIFMGLQVPSRDGLARNYPGNGTYNNYRAVLNYVFDLQEVYAELSAENQNVSWINISGQFDTQNNMPALPMPVNIRNDTTKWSQYNGVHPDMSGYMQIADAVYRDFVGRLRK